MAKKWHETKIKKYVNKFNYEVLNCFYDNKKSKWKLILMCPKFHIFKIDFDKFQQGKRCSYCNGSKFDEDFIREYMLNNGDRLMSHYYSMNKKIKVMCKHGHIFYPTFGNYYYKNSRCPFCEGNKKLTHEEFLERFYKQNSNAENIDILGKYVNAHTKIKCKCKIDEYEWETTPDKLLMNNGCPKCANNIQLTHEEFVNKMKEINNDIEILGKYVNSYTKIKCKCKIDGYEWEVRPSNLSKGTGCPKCANRKMRGKNNPNWKFDKTDEERVDDRSYSEYGEWRVKCFERDNYTCKVTGKKGGKLVVHHLYSYNKYRCLRTVVENGITISEEIHKQFHLIYGYGDNTLEQWEEFIKSLK